MFILLPQIDQWQAEQMNRQLTRKLEQAPSEDRDLQQYPLWADLGGKYCESPGRVLANMLDSIRWLKQYYLSIILVHEIKVP